MKADHRRRSKEVSWNELGSCQRHNPLKCELHGIGPTSIFTVQYLVTDVVLCPFNINYAFWSSLSYTVRSILCFLIECVPSVLQFVHQWTTTNVSFHGWNRVLWTKQHNYMCELTLATFVNAVCGLCPAVLFVVFTECRHRPIDNTCVS